MESKGIAGFEVSLNDKAQSSKPKTPNAKKCATLSSPGTSPIILAGGCDDSIKSIVIQPLIISINKMIIRMLLAEAVISMQLD